MHWVKPQAYKHFKLEKKGMTWDEANAYCKKNGGQLAKINSAHQNAQMKAMIGNKSAWIGANDKAVSLQRKTLVVVFGL